MRRNDTSLQELISWSNDRKTKIELYTRSTYKKYIGYISPISSTLY